MIGPHQSIAEMYSELCRQYREYKRDEASGDLVCAHCNATKKSHIGEDARCTVCATSFKFYPENAARLEEVEKTLALIEQMAEVNRWRL